MKTWGLSHDKRNSEVFALVLALIFVLTVQFMLARDKYCTVLKSENISG